MACQVMVHSWTFSGLVGAFLDLAIAYLLLCCSTVAYFIAKFLAFLGLSLPCPCNGLFGYPIRGPCVQRVLVDYPTETVSSIQLSVKSKFPFDSILARNDHCQLNLKLIKERKLDDGGVELEGEASYSSFSDPRRSHHSLSGTGSDSIGRFDLKGKGTVAPRQRCGLNRRRRRGSIDYGKLTSGSFYDHMRSDVRLIRRSPSDPSKIGNELSAESFVPINFHDVQDPSTVPRRTVSDFESNDATDNGNLTYGNAVASLDNLRNNLRRGQGGGDGQDENAVKILEQALEEEQAARAALWSELEEERLAAATAADEAMAMISRLQEEKASIEIEARQYQRILEEKSAYDAEEMSILKEIIVRREWEKHFFEKEVEDYRKLLQENEDSEGQGDYVQASFLGSVDQMLMLQQLNESIDKRGNVQNKSNDPDYASTSVGKQTRTISLDKESSVIEMDYENNSVKVPDSPESHISRDHLLSGDETSQHIQEKGMLSKDEVQNPKVCESSRFPGHEFSENNAILAGKQGQTDLQQKIIPVEVKTDEEKEMQMQGREPHVHDVHIIDSKCSTTKRVDPLLVHDVARKCELPSEASVFRRVDDSAKNSLKVELDINRSCSDIVDRFPSVGCSPSRSFVSELRRNSLSAVDHERMKIDSEIGWLRARLRSVQEEKEKLTKSLERRERGRTELRLLEDIADQLREIRHLTAPEKAARQASLPPLSSKVISKKRRSRSISVGVEQSGSGST